MSDAGPCPGVARAILGAVDAPDGVLLRCGLARGHDGLHRFLMEWSDPMPGGQMIVADEIEGYLARQRLDPNFRRRIAERIEKDAKILKRLAKDDGPGQPS